MSSNGSGPGRGGRWDVFVRNLREAKEHVEVWLQVSLQRGNIENIGEIIEFARNEGVGADLMNIVHFPEHLSIGGLDPAAKGVHRARLSDLAAYCRSDGRAEVARHLEMAADFLAKDPHD